MSVFIPLYRNQAPYTDLALQRLKAQCIRANRDRNTGLSPHEAVRKHECYRDSVRLAYRLEFPDHVAVFYPWLDGLYRLTPDSRLSPLP